jgi:hypothetical protein
MLSPLSPSASAKFISQAVGQRPEPASAAQATLHPFVPKGVGVGSGTTQVKGGALAALAFRALAGATDMPNGTNGTFGNGTIEPFPNTTLANGTSTETGPVVSNPILYVGFFAPLILIGCVCGAQCVKQGCCAPRSQGAYAPPSTQMTAPPSAQEDSV